MAAVLVFPRASAALVAAHVRPGMRVVAIDAGADVLETCGLTPELAVGDMDSVSPGVLDRLRGKGVEIEIHPSDKRDTDAAIALRHVADEESILFLGPGGGRADHALANLHLLVSARGRAQAVDEDAHTWVVTPERPLRLALPVGETLSMLPFGGPVEGVTYEGLAYPLVDASMDVGDPYGMSNRCLAPPQTIRVSRGALVVIRPLAPGAHVEPWRP